MELGGTEEEPQMEKAKGPNKYSKRHLHSTEHILHCEQSVDKVWSPRLDVLRRKVRWGHWEKEAPYVASFSINTRHITSQTTLLAPRKQNQQGCLPVSLVPDSKEICFVAKSSLWT